MKYFKVLGIDPVRLDLDLSELEKRFYERSFQVHPDLHPEADAISQAAELNRAYKTLRDPWQRAHYVTKEVQGVDHASKIPTALAEFYFETQEIEDREALRDLQKRLEEEGKTRHNKLLSFFKEYDENQDQRERVLEKIKAIVLENSYAQSMLRDLLLKMEKL